MSNEGLDVLGLGGLAERRRALATELAAHRRAAALSQETVAERMGTSQPAIARLEAGEADVRLSTVERYAAAIGCRLEVARRAGAQRFVKQQGDRAMRPERPWGVPSEDPRQPWPPTEQPVPVAPWLEERLFDQRIVMLSGSLDASTATRTAAALMALDAAGIEPIRLQMSTPDGELSGAFAVG